VEVRVGVDLASIARIERVHQRFSRRFLERFLTPAEIAYCGGQPARWAARWAAKEALFKALSATTFPPPFRSVEILPGADGRPVVALDPARIAPGVQVDVSISHDGGFAVAVATARTPRATPAEPPPAGFRLPDRPAEGHKGTFGTVVVLAGSTGFTGAAFLCATAAARAGAGLVRLLVAESLYSILALKCTEVMVMPVPEVSSGVPGHASSELVLRRFEGATVGCVGPGLGRDPSTRRLVADVVQHVRCPLVLDADALNLLSENRRLLERLNPENILTPHPAEMARLTGMTVAAIQAERKETAARFARQWRQVVVLKGAHTVVAAPDGPVTVDPHANAALATGGTGDVLSGLVAGLRAQGVSSFEAAVTAVFLQGEAAAVLSEELADAGLLASDLLPVLPRVMAQFKRR